MAFLKSIPKPLIAAGCWLLAVGWPMLAVFLLVNLKAFSGVSMGSILDSTVGMYPFFLIFLPIIYLFYFLGVSFLFLSYLPFERKTKKNNMAAFFILVIIVTVIIANQYSL